MNYKKIGLFTLFKDNFGSILQCYSTKITIESLGFECEVMYERESKNFLVKFFKKSHSAFILLLHSFKDRSYFKRRKILKASYKKDAKILTKESREKMDGFVSQELRPNGYTWHQLKKIGTCREYRCFISGSDQVWNASRPIPEVYFLSFAPQKKRIAFAPSFGVGEIPGFNSAIKKSINQFSAISVREETAERILKQFYKKSIYKIGDPTIMLSADQWRAFYGGGAKVFGDYIFLHFLNQPSEILIKNITSLLQKNPALKVIAFAYYHDEFSKLGNFSFLDGGPEDYLSLIDHSSCVFTDSFHTTLFSINFGKDFLVYPRNYSHNYSQASRIIDLLTRYGYLDRLVSEEDDFAKVVSRVDNKCLDSDREKTINYLSNTILGVS